MEQKKKRGRPKKQQTIQTIGYNEDQKKETSVISGKEEKSEKEKLDDLQDDFNTSKEEEPTPKKKSSYKTKKEKELEELEKKESFTKNVSGIGSTVMDIFLDRVGYDKLNNTETEKLNETLDNLIMKYVSVVGDFQEETAFGMVLLMILLPRTKILSKKVIENE